MAAPRPDVSALIARWIREQSRRRALKDIGDELRISKTHVINVRDGSNVGADLESRFAEIKYGGSVDRLREDARAQWEAERVRPESEIDADELARYPGLAVLASTEFFRAAPEKVRARVLKWRNAIGDAKPSAWFTLFESVLDRHNRGESIDE